MHRSQVGLLPAVAVDQASGSLATRTLVLTSGKDGVGYRLMGAEVGDAARTLPLTTAEPLTASAAAALVSGPGNGTSTATAGELARLGVGFVVATVPVSDTLEQRLDTTPGLTRLGESGTYALWRLESAQPVARVRLVDATGGLLQNVPVAGPNARVNTVIPAGAPGRVLVLAEPAGPTWRATLDGRRLEPAAASGTDGLQSYAVPASGGRLRVTSVDDRRNLLRGQGIALVVIALLALPLGRRRRPQTVFDLAVSEPEGTAPAEAQNAETTPVEATPAEATPAAAEVSEEGSGEVSDGPVDVEAAP